MQKHCPDSCAGIHIRAKWYIDCSCSIPNTTTNHTQQLRMSNSPFQAVNVKMPKKAKTWFTVCDLYHFIFNEDLDKMNLNGPWMRNQKGRIPGCRQSMKGYILTYSVAKKWNLWELLFFSRVMDWWIKNNNKKQLQNRYWHMFTDNRYQLQSNYHHLHAESNSNHSAFHQTAHRHMAVRLKACACINRQSSELSTELSSPCRVGLKPETCWASPWGPTSTILRRAVRHPWGPTSTILRRAVRHPWGPTSTILRRAVRHPEDLPPQSWDVLSVTLRTYLHNPETCCASPWGPTSTILRRAVRHPEDLPPQSWDVLCVTLRTYLHNPETCCASPWGPTSTILRRAVRHPEDLPPQSWDVLSVTPEDLPPQSWDVLCVTLRTYLHNPETCWASPLRTYLHNPETCCASPLRTYLHNPETCCASPWGPTSTILRRAVRHPEDLHPQSWDVLCITPEDLPPQSWDVLCVTLRTYLHNPETCCASPWGPTSTILRRAVRHPEDLPPQSSCVRLGSACGICMTAACRSGRGSHPCQHWGNCTGTQNQFHQAGN